MSPAYRLPSPVLIFIKLSFLFIAFLTYFPHLTVPMPVEMGLTIFPIFSIPMKIIVLSFFANIPSAHGCQGESAVFSVCFRTGLFVPTAMISKNWSCRWSPNFLASRGSARLRKKHLLHRSRGLSLAKFNSSSPENFHSKLMKRQQVLFCLHLWLDSYRIASRDGRAREIPMRHSWSVVRGAWMHA